MQTDAIQFDLEKVKRTLDLDMTKQEVLDYAEKLLGLSKREKHQLGKSHFTAYIKLQVFRMAKQRHAVEQVKSRKARVSNQNHTFEGEYHAYRRQAKPRTND